MPTTQQQPKQLNARRFAVLLAGFDTGNASEEEALSKGRALRRMASESGLRIVDALEMPDVKQAVDDQMQPKRQENAEVQYALEELALLRGQLGERTAEMERLKLSFEQDKQLFELHAAKLEARLKGPATDFRPCFGVPAWNIELFVIFFALMCMCDAAFR